MRIVSLLPSATDIVCMLGLQDHLVGRTHECDWPPAVDGVPAMTKDLLATQEMASREIHEAVGGSVHTGSSIYALDTEALERAKPDLILTQELCDVCAVSYEDVSSAARMLEADVSVVSLEPHGIEDILSHVELVGRLCGVEKRAQHATEGLRARLRRLRTATQGRKRPRVFCCEWLDPVFAAGHWVPEQVEAAGGEELLGPRGEPSPQLPWERVVEADPDVLVLMPCGMPIARTLDELDAIRGRPGFRDLSAVKRGAVWVVDASSYFNRPGPRVVRGAEVLAAILHEEGAGLREDEAVRVAWGSAALAD